MAKVYIVSEQLYKRAYNAEPFRVEGIIKVFDDYHKVISYICDVIRKDHRRLDKSKDDLTHWHKYEPNPDEFLEGYFIPSVEYDNNTYYESTRYRFRYYDVE